MNTILLRSLVFLTLTILLCLSGRAQTHESPLSEAKDEQEAFFTAQNVDSISTWLIFINAFPESHYKKGACYGLARSYGSAKDYMKAINVYHKIMQDFPEETNRCEKIISILLRPDNTQVKIENLGDGINTKYDEYFPVVSADGKTMYFCKNDFLDDDRTLLLADKMQRAAQLTSKEHNYIKERLIGSTQEDIWVSENDNSNWSKARKISSLNTTENEAMLSLSVDGTSAYIFRNGIIMTTKLLKNGDWELPVSVGPPINSGIWDADVCISNDGNHLFFVSKRHGCLVDTAGLFSRDIFVSEKQGDRWGEPISLGPIVNTPGDERTPFLASDGKTLFFSSDGHPGLGGLDVFKTVHIGESWTEWTEPENLGSQINTAKTDWSFVVPSSGEVGYITIADRADGHGRQDIYRLSPLPPECRPVIPVVSIKGTIKLNNGEPVADSVYWEDLATGRSIGVARSSPVDGKYFITFPAGHNYGYYVGSDTCYPVSNHIDLTNIDSLRKIGYNEITIDIVLCKENITISNMFFDFNKADILPTSELELLRLVEYLKKYSKMRIEIRGHTDERGSDEYNDNLSRRRAQAVVKYLINHGIAANKLKAIGCGKRYPIDPHDTEEAYAKNRRVDFRIIKDIEK
jgi:outer membrane protein OmpA-like peptidoglycan-associated protein